MKKRFPNHKPHDPRKTFVTLAKKAEVNDFAIKRIVGHAIEDITENVYTERDIEWLCQEAAKIV
jgi:integrase